MRIAVSNPDNLGDVLLREPLFAALHEAGHQLLLIVRDFVAPLARDIAPYAEIAVCPGNPYVANFHFNTPLGEESRERIRKFAPQLLVLGAYHFTDMDQQIAAFLPGVETVGLSGSLFQPQQNLTIPTTLQLTTRVAVSLDTPEPVKTELLCSAILSSAVNLRPPRLEPTAAGKSLAATHLRKLGLKDSPFWAVCAGDRPPWGVKNWEKDKWIQLCRTLIEDHGIRILFVGSEAEHEETSAIQAGLGTAGRRTASITGSAIPVSELVALLAAAKGYIGKDTGPMHIAAALGKPVVAVFGGGHWPRFVPQAKSGAVFSVDMPCKGCDWICRLERSHCVKDIPLAPVLAAAVAAVEGRAEAFRVELLPRDGLLDAEMFQEMYRSAQTAYRLLETERSNFMQWHGDRVRDIEQLQAQLSEERAQATALARAKEQAEALAAERDALVTDRDALVANRDALVANRDALVADRDALAADCDALRDHVRSLESARVEIERDRHGLSQERDALAADCDALRDHVRSLESARVEIERDRHGLSQERDALAMQTSDAQVRIRDLESRLSALEVSAQSIEQERGELAARLTEAYSRINSLESQLAAAVDAAQSHQEERNRLQFMVEEARQQGRAEAESVAAELIRARDNALESATRRLQTLETELAVQTIHSREYREDARRLEMRVDSLEVEERQLRDELAESAESAKAKTKQITDRLETSLLEKSLLITELQAYIDTVESRHTGRIADLEKVLQQERRQSQLALALVPELRDELTNEQRDLADLRNALHQFRHTSGIHSGEPKGILEEATTRLRSAEGQIADFSERLRIAAGWQARPSGWLENLEFVEEDRAARLDMVHKLTAQIRDVEEAGNVRIAATIAELEEVASRLQIALGDRASGSGWPEDFALLEEDREERLRQILQLANEVNEFSNLVRQGAGNESASAGWRDNLAAILQLASEVNEFSNLVRQGTGNESASAGWRDNLAAIEDDRRQRLAIIEKLSEAIRDIEADRAQRGTQIETLHRHIEGLVRDKQALERTVALRLMRTLGLMKA